jgi:hypothetical protein
VLALRTLGLANSLIVVSGSTFAEQCGWMSWRIKPMISRRHRLSGLHCIGHFGARLKEYGKGPL